MSTSSAWRRAGAIRIEIDFMTFTEKILKLRSR